MSDDLAKDRIFYNFTVIEASKGNDELSGQNAFYNNDNGEIFHTYSSYARGPEELIGTLMIFDRAPKGRNEDGTMNFVRRHDGYEERPMSGARCH